MVPDCSRCRIAAAEPTDGKNADAGLLPHSFTHLRSLRPPDSLLIRSARKTSIWLRAENRTQACLISKSVHYQLKQIIPTESNAEPYGGTHAVSTELRCTLPSYATPCWADPCILLSYAESCWNTLHPSEQCSESMTFGVDPDPCLWLMDPDPDPAFFVIDLQDANKKQF